MRARFLAKETYRGVSRNITMTLALILTVAISLSLFGVGFLVQRQANTMKDYWYDKVELSVFLCGGVSSSEKCPTAVTQDQRDNIRMTLESLPGVQKVYYESNQEAYDRFKEQFKNSPILSSV